jgi:hypothetical protein
MERARVAAACKSLVNVRSVGFHAARLLDDGLDPGGKPLDA